MLPSKFIKFIPIKYIFTIVDAANKQKLKHLANF